MMIEAIVCVLKDDISLKNTVFQIIKIWWESAPNNILTFFMGMVLSLQVGSATINIFDKLILC
ncbi:MAG: hypothetical protein LBS15_01320 [Endomicrobium sp.]|jgi:hypothetical protein|nr:hypothetical protein [Endomicrobium sp.]